VGLLNEDINSVVSAASEDFRSLEAVVRSVARLRLSPSVASRSISPSIQSNLFGISDRIHSRTRKLRAIIDKASGREDWSNLVAKSPKTPPQKKGTSSLRVDSKNVSFASSAVSLASGSSSGRSAPPSPFKVTVEEVPDAGEDEVNHGVYKYHVPPAEGSPPTSSQSNRTGLSSSQDVPKVVLRAPTDPSGLEEAIEVLNFGSTTDSNSLDKEQVDKADAQKAWSSMGPRNPTPYSMTPTMTPTITAEPDAFSPVLVNRRDSTASVAAERETIGEEIRALEAQLLKLKAAKGSSDSLSSSLYPASKYSADSLKGKSSTRPLGLGLGGSSDERLDVRPSALNKNRPRASTTSNVDYGRPAFLSERHPRYYHGGDSFERGRDSLDVNSAYTGGARESTVSPGMSPRTAPGMSPRIVPGMSPRTAPSSMHNSPRYAPDKEFSASSSRRGSRSGSESRSGWRRSRDERSGSFGQDPHASLPAVLETGRSNLADTSRDPLGRKPSVSDKSKRASWAPAPDKPFFGNSPNIAASNKRASWAPPDHDDDHEDWRGTDFELFPDAGASAPPPVIPSSPNPAGNKFDKKAEDDSLPPNVMMRDLPVALEDMYRGATMQVRFMRRGAPAHTSSSKPSSSSEKLGVGSTPELRGRHRSRSRSVCTEEVLITVTIPRGLKTGNKLRYIGEGDYLETVNGRIRRGDLWFRLVEKVHEMFERRELDLYTRIDLTLQEALCGDWSRSVRSICGREIKIAPGLDVNTGSGFSRYPELASSSLVPVTGHGWKVRVKGLGMPKYKDANKREETDPKDDRGDLVLETKVTWPQRMAQWQTDLIIKALSGRS
jgi:DnaJ C terminal domain